MKQNTKLLKHIADAPAIVLLAVVLFFRDYLYGVGTAVVVSIAAAASIGSSIVLHIKKLNSTENVITDGLLGIILLATYFAVGFFNVESVLWLCVECIILVAYFVYLCVGNAENKTNTENILLYSITLLCSYILTV